MIFGSQPFSHVSAVASEQSCASLQMFGTTMPTFGSVPAFTSSSSAPLVVVPEGTSRVAQPDVAGVASNGHGLCLT